MAYKPRHLFTDANISAVSGLDDSGISTSSSSFGFSCQPLRPYNSSFKESAFAGSSSASLQSVLLGRAHSMADLPSLPHFPRRSGGDGAAEARAHPLGMGLGGSFGGRDFAASSGDPDSTPLKVRTLAERKEVGMPKAPHPGLVSPVLCRRDGGGCPLSHAAGLHGFPDGGPSPEEAVGVLTPLQGGVARPPSMRKLCSSCL